MFKKYAPGILFGVNRDRKTLTMSERTIFVCWILSVIGNGRPSLTKFLNQPENKFILDYIRKQTLPLQDGNHHVIEMIYWIKEKIKDWDDPKVRCHNETCNKPLKGKFRGLNIGYRKFCSKECANTCEASRQHAKETIAKDKDFYKRRTVKMKATFMKNYGVDNNMKCEKGKKELQDAIEQKYGEGITNAFQAKEVIEKIEDTKEKRYNDRKFNNQRKRLETIKNIPDFEEKRQLKKKQTCLKKYNVDHPMKVPEIAQKSHEEWQKACSKYTLDGLLFDSLPELCFFIWCKDNNLEILREPYPIKYLDNNGNCHQYYPDFFVKQWDRLVEIKGDNHFKDYNPETRMISFKGPEYDHIEQAKQVCMKENNVLILTGDQYDKYQKYVKAIYGQKFIRDCKLQSL